MVPSYKPDMSLGILFHNWFQHNSLSTISYLPITFFITFDTNKIFCDQLDNIKYNTLIAKTQKKSKNATWYLSALMERFVQKVTWLKLTGSSCSWRQFRFLSFIHNDQEVSTMDDFGKFQPHQTANNKVVITFGL